MFDKEKLNNYLAAGKENEKSFLKCLEGCYEDISSVESTKEQDMKEHWDLKIMQEFTVDV
jgi:hypothetical protein